MSFFPKKLNFKKLAAVKEEKVIQAIFQAKSQELKISTRKSEKNSTQTK